MYQENRRMLFPLGTCIMLDSLYTQYQPSCEIFHSDISFFKAGGTSYFYLLLCFTNRLITAFDKDPERFSIFKDRLKEAGATCVLPLLADFLQVSVSNHLILRMLTIVMY